MSTATAPRVVPPLTPLPAHYVPDWARERSVLLRQGVPDHVPFMEVGLDTVHKARVLGRPVETLADDLEVSRLVGQPFVVISLGLHNHPAVLAAMEALEIQPEAGDPSWAHSKARRWAHGTSNVITSEADFERFPWPSVEEIDLSILDEADRMLPANTRVILAVGKVFNLAWWLMGFDAFAYALVDQPEVIERLYARIAQIQVGVVERALSHRSIGMVWHADDIAYKTGLMVSPTILRQHVFPAYAKMNAMCHAQDVLCGYHSDGNVEMVIEDVIAAGFESFNPIEPLAMDIVALKKRVAGRLTLIGNVDLAYTLTRGTEAEVDAEVRELMRTVAPGGGYALASANSVPEYVPWRNFVALHAAWLKYGKYPICV
jgi:uroporphyrinogen decarboxylase